MSAFVKDFSKKDARILLEAMEKEAHPWAVQEALRRLRFSAETSTKASRARSAAREVKQSKHELRVEKRSKVYVAVEKRAGGRCEMCGMEFSDADPPELDHQEGRGRSESVETTWLLHRSCHRLKTNNDPSAAHWLEKIVAHAERYVYRKTAARARARLEGIVAARERESAR